MRFEFGLEKRKRVDVSEVWWQRFPGPGSRAAESPGPHSGQSRRRDSEVKRRGGSEAARWDDNMDKVRQISRTGVMDGLKCVHRHFERDPKFNREPVKLLQNRSNVVFFDYINRIILD